MAGRPWTKATMDGRPFTVESGSECDAQAMVGDGYTSDSHPAPCPPRKNTGKEKHREKIKLKGQGKEVEEPPPYRRPDPVARQKKQPPPKKAALPPLPEQRHESEKDPTGVGRCKFGRGPEKPLESQATETPDGPSQRTLLPPCPGQLRSARPDEKCPSLTNSLSDQDVDSDNFNSEPGITLSDCESVSDTSKEPKGQLSWWIRLKQAIVRLKRKFYFKARRMSNHYVVGARLSWKAGFGVLLRLDVIVPTGIVAGLCMLAEFAVETAKLSNDLYSVDQSGPTKWMLERLTPGIDVGTEAHEILGLVLGFLLAQYAQFAASRFTEADADIQEMCACLKQVALACLPNLKQCRKVRGRARIHSQFAKSLCILLLMSNRDLQNGSVDGPFSAEEQWQKLEDLGASSEEQTALGNARPDMRVYLSLHWIHMLVDAAVEYKWLKQKPADVARSNLDQVILKWKHARSVAYADKPRLLEGLLSMLMYVFCFTLPFPLAAKLEGWCTPVAIIVSISFFALKAAAAEMMEPFGFDSGDVKLNSYYNDFEEFVPRVVEYLGYRPTERQEIIDWHGGERLFPGTAMPAPPGNKSLQFLLMKYLGWHFGVRVSARKSALEKVLYRPSVSSVEGELVQPEQDPVYKIKVTDLSSPA
ncbi:SF3B4 [Symbiodinium microadriaticum]|nr:SF3B4 [Symbiodinium microadriaticum]